MAGLMQASTHTSFAAFQGPCSKGVTTTKRAHDLDISNTMLLFAASYLCTTRRDHIFQK